MFQNQNQPTYNGPWSFGSDDSAHKLGLRPTTDDGIVALGSDDHGNPILVTTEQVTRFATAVKEGKYDSILAP